MPSASKLKLYNQDQIVTFSQQLAPSFEAERPVLTAIDTIDMCLITEKRYLQNERTKV